MRHLTVAGVLVVSTALSSHAVWQPLQPFDLVITGGRVMDPETGLDAVRNVGISEGRIAALTDAPIEGRQTLAAEGLVVAPGFIDLHAHGQDPVSHAFQAADGVTTALEMEVGVHPVGKWLRSREGKALVNYGATAGHWPARAHLVDAVELGHFPTLPPNDLAKLNTGKHAYADLSAARIDDLLGLIRQDLDDGALGVGLALAYVPGVSRYEILRTFQFAAERRVPIYVHLRGKDSGGPIGAFQEVIANAAATGASLHVVHLNSVSDERAKDTLGMVRGARARGLDVTTETYPYTAGSTLIQTAMFDDWDKRTREEYQTLQWAATGERLTRETFLRYRKQGGWVIRHSREETLNEWIVAQPDVMIASDGIPYLHGPAHPRGAGTYARVLGLYVRERKALGLMDALRKMTLMPADRLAAVAPQMKKKGRVQVGMDADLTAFDPLTVIDRSTYERGNVTSAGIRHVLVGGTPVVRDAKPVDGIWPGKAIRGGTPR